MMTPAEALAAGARILRDIDDASAPDQMTKSQALEWLEELITDLQSRCEALREEITNEDNDV